MKGELLILFVILLLGLILCSFLGGRGCIEGMENNSSSEIFYEPNGAYAELQKSDDVYTLVLTNSNGITTTFNPVKNKTNMFISPDGEKAIINYGSYGINFIQIKDIDNNVILTLTNNPNKGNITNNNQTDIMIFNYDTYDDYNSYDNYDHYNKSSYPSILYGSDGSTAKINQSLNNNNIVITNKNGSTDIFYIDKNATDPNFATYYSLNGSIANIIHDNGKRSIEIMKPNGNIIVYNGNSNNTNYGNVQDNMLNQYDVDNNTLGTDINTLTNNNLPNPQTNNNLPNPQTNNNLPNPQTNNSTTISGPAGNTYSTYDSSAYLNSLPQGIPRNQIPPGDEDLYILKSQIVPPVCPKCPDVIQQCPDNFDATKCPPCKPCGRCELPPFECVKRPTYNAFNQNYMPVPVISDFSGFGM